MLGLSSDEARAAVMLTMSSSSLTGGAGGHVVVVPSDWCWWQSSSPLGDTRVVVDVIDVKNCPGLLRWSLRHGSRHWIRLEWGHHRCHRVRSDSQGLAVPFGETVG